MDHAAVQDLLRCALICCLLQGRSSGLPPTLPAALPGQENATTPSTSPFLPYGVSAGDTTTFADTNLIGPLELSDPLRFYVKNLTSLYIAPSGLISSSPRLTEVDLLDSFPLAADLFIPLIVPLWANFRPLTISYRVTEDTDTLQQVTEMIADRNPELSSYQPSLAVVITVVDAELSFQSNTTVTYQTVLSTDGTASFAAFIYDDLTAVAAITGNVQIGFDAGDEIRASVVFSPTEPNNLKQVNLFRIDGNCITGIESAEVCELGSMSTGCSQINTTATTDCMCNHGVNATNCQDSVEFTCPEGSVPFPECSAIFPVCISEDKLCNSIADCDRAAEELPSFCGNNITFIPYGPGINDTQVDFTEELHYYNIRKVATPIIFYRQELFQLYASYNGLVTFVYDLLSPQVQSIPRTGYPLIPVVAPLWTRYTPQTLGSLFSRISYDPLDLNLVKQIISQQNPNSTDYSPSVAVIVTWHNYVLPNDDVITFQAILSSNGRASFVIYVYNEEGIDMINNLSSHKLIGFDASDTIRSATIVSSGFSSLPTLRHFNTFRIDGHCVTTAYPGEVCDLDSYAVGCDVNGLTATACRCYETVDLNTTSSNCSPTATFVCEEGSVPSICPGGGDDSPYLGCFPDAFFCNRASDCPGGIDEINCTANGEQSPRFLPFGDGLEDIVGNSDEDTAASFNLSVPILFYQQRHTRLFVSPNGFISIQAELTSFQSYEAVPFPTTVVPVIAPLWADYDFRVTGAVYSRVTNDSDTLNQVVEILADMNSALSDYQPSLAVVATWFEPRLHDETSSPSGPPVIGTFQAILATDGATTFAVFIYDEIDLVDEIQYYQVGFNSGDDAKFLNIVGRCPAMYTGNLQEINAFRIDGSCITSVLPGEMCGLGAVATECPEVSLTATECVCDSGFQYQGDSCTDINECVDTAHGCDMNAECVNSLGSFDCICNSGHSGDGFNCSAPSTTDATNSNATAIGVAMALILLVVFAAITAVVVGIAVVLTKREKMKRLVIDEDIAGSKLELEISPKNKYFERNLSLISQFGLDDSRPLLVKSSNLELGQTIGQGEFGIVYRGMLKNEAYDETVAVKTLRGFFDENVVDDLLKECTRMQGFDHPNVLRLIGVCLDGGPAPYIIMPFMKNGSLLSHLKESRDTLVIPPQTLDLDDVIDVQKKLLDMCIQVAKGMEYLSSKRLIHRDLAARNCMIDSYFVIKVADFGLTESVAANEKYVRMSPDNKVKVPVKWMAIESLSDGIFSEKTDVWAYGVTCWEIFSGGKMPYPGIHPLDLVGKLEAGYRMEKPPNIACSDKLFSLIATCWSQQAEQRPPFSELVNQLAAYLSKIANYFDLSTQLIVTDSLAVELPDSRQMDIASISSNNIL